MPWYADLDRPSAEERFYRTRGGEQHHWNTDGLPEWLDEALAGLRAEHRSLPAEAVLRLRMFVRLHWTLRGRRLLPARPAP